MNSADASPSARKPPRNPAVDFFRGFALVVIYLAHAMGNPLSHYLPRNFGFSDAAEIFIFCSGLACAYAFGRLFDGIGYLHATARIFYRCWQLYWAHICLSLIVIFISLGAHEIFGPLRSFLDYEWFFREPSEALPALVALTWLPANVNILPVYLALLAAVPLMMFARQVWRYLPFAILIPLYVWVWIYDIHIFGPTIYERSWFFNPLAWQLLFFTAYFIGMGWIKLPALNHPVLMAICIVFLIAAIPLSYPDIVYPNESLAGIRRSVIFGLEKHNLHITRYIHFLCLAYVVTSLFDKYKALLAARCLFPLIMIGRHALAAFIAGVVLARAASIAFEKLGPQPWLVLLVNIGGCAMLFAVAHSVGWIKSLSLKRVDNGT